MAGYFYYYGCTLGTIYLLVPARNRLRFVYGPEIWDYSIVSSNFEGTRIPYRSKIWIYAWMILMESETIIVGNRYVYSVGTVSCTQLLHSTEYVDYPTSPDWMRKSACRYSHYPTLPESVGKHGYVDTVNLKFRRLKIFKQARYYVVTEPRYVEKSEYRYPIERLCCDAVELEINFASSASQWTS